VGWAKQGVLVSAPPPLKWASSHAALPVVRQLSDGGTELYFSTRDEGGRSHIARARLPAGDELGHPAYEPDPLLAPGRLGAFDDAGVTTSCLVELESRLFLYYSGWSLGVSVPFYFFVGCAASDDGGRTFTRVSPSPVLERDEVDPYLTASPWVLVEDGVWRMWYVSGTRWEVRDGRPEHRYHIKYAESRDGLSWARQGRVCIDYRDDSEYAIARPCVVRDEPGYRMWYSSRGDAYRLGYAESADGLTWERKDGEAGLDTSSSGWDSEMVAYPLVFDRGGRRYLLYNGNGYGATGIGVAIDAG
jgi:hypothetical protein